MSELPSQEGFVDPNARLLASVMPPPPPTFWQRFGQGLKGWRFAPGAIVRWSRSREGRSCFFVALAAAALAVVLYRSEPSSFARTGSAISGEPRPSSAIMAKQESVRPAPRPLAAPIVPAVAVEEQSAPVDDADQAEDAEPPVAKSTARRARSGRESQLRGGSARSERYASAKKARKKLEKRKAKRKAVARTSARARRAKSKPAKTSSPLRAWIATRSRDEAGSSKSR